MNCTFHLAHGIERPATKLIGDDAMCTDCFAGKPITKSQDSGDPKFTDTKKLLSDRRRGREYYWKNRKEIRRRQQAARRSA